MILAEFTLCTLSTLSALGVAVDSWIPTRIFDEHMPECPYRLAKPSANRQKFQVYLCWQTFPTPRIHFELYLHSPPSHAEIFTSLRCQFPQGFLGFLARTKIRQEAAQSK
ncbi:hypothetical protein B0H16DRAFT_229844 [Mycena metata]|uniref:Secreted protein n=1 Tax=Mycena metata TaxID=1033252 RepID=A0AAD7HVA7_9AGAR|nr:hypothetical protein B0H16DRAFT_229844 [Mycena metata]